MSSEEEPDSVSASDTQYTGGEGNSSSLAPLETGDLAVSLSPPSADGQAEENPNDPETLFALDCMMEFALYQSYSDILPLLARCYPEGLMPSFLQSELLHLALERNLSDFDWILTPAAPQFVDFLNSLTNFSLPPTLSIELSEFIVAMKRQIILQRLLSGDPEGARSLWTILFRNEEKSTEKLKNKVDVAVRQLTNLLKDELADLLESQPSKNFPNPDNENPSHSAQLTRYSQLYPYQQFSRDCLDFLARVKVRWPQPRFFNLLASHRQPARKPLNHQEPETPVKKIKLSSQRSTPLSRGSRSKVVLRPVPSGPPANFLFLASISLSALRSTFPSAAWNLIGNEEEPAVKEFLTHKRKAK